MIVNAHMHNIINIHRQTSRATINKTGEGTGEEEEGENQKLEAEKGEITDWDLSAERCAGGMIRGESFKTVIFLEEFE